MRNDRLSPDTDSGKVHVSLPAFACKAIIQDIAMNHDLLPGSTRLDNGRLLSRVTGPDERIECLSGVLWVTQDGDPRDIILEAGDGFDFDRRGRSVISAFDDSRLLLLTRLRP